MQHNKRRRSIIVTTIALVSILLAIGYTGYAINNQPEPEPSKIKISVPRVSVQLLNSGTHYSSISSFAEFQASNEISLNSLGRVLNSIDSYLNGLKMAKSCQTVSNS